MNNLEFVYVTYIRTSPEKLWDALINPEFTLQYWGRKIESDWQLGSHVAHFLSDGTIETGTVIESDPPNRLCYTFESDDDDLKGTKATMILKPQGSTVQLTVIHENLSEAGYRSISSGWPGVLSGLKTLLETGRVLDREPQ
jgi:uncharacterized protein YndB with AHSA1/START domain